MSDTTNRTSNALDPLHDLDTDYLTVGATGDGCDMDVLATFTCNDARVPREVMETAIRNFVNAVRPHCPDLAVIERQETMDTLDLDEDEFKEARFQADLHNAFAALGRAAAAWGVSVDRMQFDSLIDMARLHQEWAADILNTGGDDEQEARLDTLERIISEHVSEMKGIEGVSFSRDARGSTVRLTLSSGEENSLVGGYALPVQPWADPGRDAQLQQQVESRLPEEAPQMDQETHTRINWLDREDIVKILENYGFACYDSESTDALRDALRSNIADGTIDPSVLDSAPSPSSGRPGF